VKQHVETIVSELVNKAKAEASDAADAAADKAKEAAADLAAQVMDGVDNLIPDESKGLLGEALNSISSLASDAVAGAAAKREPHRVREIAALGAQLVAHALSGAATSAADRALLDDARAALAKRVWLEWHPAPRRALEYVARSSY